MKHSWDILQHDWVTGIDKTKLYQNSSNVVLQNFVRVILKSTVILLKTKQFTNNKNQYSLKPNFISNE